MSTIQSPDGEHELELRYKGEVRFGPPYFDLLLDGQAVVGNAYGDCWEWSECSKFLAVQHWLTTSEEDGPNTQVALFDVEAKRVSFFRELRGFVDGFAFGAGSLAYRRKGASSGTVEEVEVSISGIGNWRECAR